jgi:putative ATP-dependent endonuclease of the OLD family
MIKILNHFGSPYAVLHDSDNQRTAAGAKNSAWAANEQIGIAVAAAPYPERVRMAASIPDFESVIFGERATKDKPYNAVMRLREDTAVRTRVERLLDYLLFGGVEPPTGILPWKDIAALELAVLELKKLEPA